MIHQPKRGDLVTLINGKRYTVTRITKKHIWIKWDAYGDARRDLSHKLSREDFEATKHYYNNKPQ